MGMFALSKLPLIMRLHTVIKPTLPLGTGTSPNLSPYGAIATKSLTQSPALKAPFIDWRALANLSLRNKEILTGAIPMPVSILKEVRNAKSPIFSGIKPILSATKALFCSSIPNSVISLPSHLSAVRVSSPHIH
jgi:hypothetical protein